MDETIKERCWSEQNRPASSDSLAIPSQDFFGGGLCSTVHVERQFPFFNGLAVTAEAGKQFIAKSVTGDNVDGIYLKFLHRTKLLQD